MTPSSPSWRPRVIIFDLLTALLDSWSLWDASTPSATAAEGRIWRARYLELTFSTGAYIPYEQLVHQAAKDPWPEDAQVLEQLRLRGYKLGVVTNCSKRLGTIAADIVGKFDSIVTAEESGFYKPTEQAYQAILTKMGVQSQEALFVAGSAGDVEGATNAGMKVVWHNKVGLSRKGESVPLKEATRLDDALSGFM
ncbi:haloacid dehalogenase-like hydrolase domain-containing protein [Trichoderma breve]|uniref:Haloacid dehalogenase-like hydrolase domain-containing protein n=1 Tax=Trichoderma breve TaxID=2034170 RepID=A0A9W9E800_9HYPO|nr:haloacid dehalogenase-like hydrolase domain-containing protein [Trichoderma breve]KAJ4857976.1 haloacid dehalogenase-like hydrolase domain-containing protein [Trichoderma breve]